MIQMIYLLTYRENLRCPNYFSCFRSVLSKNQYKHLQALAFALHLAESKFVNNQMIADIDMLLNYFNEKFEHLYTVRKLLIEVV